MKTFSLTKSQLFRKEAFLNGEFKIISRSGLHIVESQMIATFTSLKDVTSALFLGGRTGASALILESLFPEAQITVHAYDIHHADTIYRNCLNNDLSPLSLTDPDMEVQGAFLRKRTRPGRLRVACTAQLPRPPEDAPYSHVFFAYSDGAMSGELALAQLDEVAHACAPNTQLILVGEEIRETFMKQIKARFNKVTFTKKRTYATIVARVAPDQKPAKSFAAQYDVSLPNHPALALETIPGVFCHRRPDLGGLALTEEVLATLDPEQAYQIIDMGCGCGMDGILLAKANSHVSVTYLDSNSLALRATARNLQAQELQARLVLSSTGFETDGTADIFLANPPYFSDYSIAELFMKTAMQALKKAGKIFFVSRNITRPKELLIELGFKNIITSYRRGYGVLQAEK